jgi:putative RecB family exonuclease
MIVAHKKSGKSFEVLKQEGGRVWLKGLDDNKEKDISESTFKKGYAQSTEDTTEDAPVSESTNKESEAPEAKEDTKEALENMEEALGEVPQIAEIDMYFYHDASDSVFKIQKGEPYFMDQLGSDGCESISMAEYQKQIAKEQVVMKQEHTTVEIGNSEVEMTSSQPIQSGWGSIEALGEIQKASDIADNMSVIEKKEIEDTLFNKEAEKQNSMKASRDHKNDDAKPFNPDPFFLRQSMISSYLQCPSKMYYTYEEKFGEDTIFTTTGTAVHGLMEDYHESIKKGKVMTRDEFEESFSVWWVNHGPSDPEWFSTWHKIVMERYDNDERQKYAPQVIGTEIEFNTTIAGVPFSGTIDRVDRIDANTVEIVDYKTNFRLFSKSEVEESVQFKVYSLALKTPEVRQILREQYGDSGEFTTVIATYDMLRMNAKQSICFSDEELGLFEKWLQVIWKKILSGTDRKPKINQYCGFCELRQNCDKYKEFLEAPISPVLISETADPKEIVENRETIQMNAKILKGRLEELDTQLKLLIGESGSIVVGDHEYSMQASRRTSYPTDRAIQIMALNGLGGNLADYMTFSSTAIKKLPPTVAEKIREIGETTYTKPSISKKKHRPKKGE